MLDRRVVKDLLDADLKERGIRMPKGISKETLAETFCRYTENDYFEWLKDNFKSFFNHGNPDWDWIKDKIGHYKSN